MYSLMWQLGYDLQCQLHHMTAQDIVQHNATHHASTCEDKMKRE